jgi:hypothetical protein
MLQHLRDLICTQTGTMRVLASLLAGLVATCHANPGGAQEMQPAPPAQAQVVVPAQQPQTQSPVRPVQVQSQQRIRNTRTERIRGDSQLRINNVIIRDRTVWYSGHWYHGWRAQQAGWWWVIGNSYYYYPAPIYPYPEIGAPPLAMAPAVPDIPTPAPAAYWNYCAEPVGYYPFIQACNTRWVRVVPQAALPLAPPPPPPWPG